MVKGLRRASVAVILLSWLAPAQSASAQQYPRDEYLRFVPLEVPRIIRQTPASERLHLYGDREDPRLR